MHKCNITTQSKIFNNRDDMLIIGALKRNSAGMQSFHGLLMQHFNLLEKIQNSLHKYYSLQNRYVMSQPLPICTRCDILVPCHRGQYCFTVTRCLVY